MGHKKIIHDVRNDHILPVSGQVPSKSSKYPPSWHPLPSWHISNWDINTKFSGYLPWGKKHHSWHQEWPCPPCLWSGTSQRPPSTPLLDTLLIGIFRVSSMGWKASFMTSGMTMSSMSPVRNPQRPPSTPFLTSLLDKLLNEISTQNFQGIFLGVKNIIHDIRNDQVLHVSSQEPSMSSKYPPSWPPFLTHL